MAWYQAGTPSTSSSSGLSLGSTNPDLSNYIPSDPFTTPIDNDILSAVSGLPAESAYAALSSTPGMLEQYADILPPHHDTPGSLYTDPAGTPGLYQRDLLDSSCTTPIPNSDHLDFQHSFNAPELSLPSDSTEDPFNYFDPPSSSSYGDPADHHHSHAWPSPSPYQSSPTPTPTTGHGPHFSTPTPTPSSLSPSLLPSSPYVHTLPDGTYRCAHPSCTSPTTFRRICDLRKHYNQHRKHLFCRYEGCPKSVDGGFSSNKDRARHEAGHNPGVLCEWPGCGRVFSRVDNMKDHVRRIHGGR